MNIRKCNNISKILRKKIPGKKDLLKVINNENKVLKLKRLKVNQVKNSFNSKNHILCSDTDIFPIYYLQRNHESEIVCL